jgi:3-oxoacyl-[acyl-carrier-protein] synthase-3
VYGARIVGIGVALPGTNCPGRVVTNATFAEELLRRRDDLHRKGELLSPDEWASLTTDRHAFHRTRWEQFETDDQWIQDHTGIKERRFADPDIATSDLATVAGKMAMQMAQWGPDDVDFLLIATVWPDHIATPPTAALVQHRLGIPASDERGSRNLDGFDIGCACSSFGKALKVGYAFIRSGLARRGLVIGADVMSRTVDPNSRNLSIILADGGGAIALEQALGANDAFYGPDGFVSGLDGSLAGLIVTAFGGTKQPIDDVGPISDPFNQGHRMAMNGGSVKKRAERLLLGFGDTPGIIDLALEKAGIGMDAIDFLALHQANLRINKPVIERLRAKGFRGAATNNIERFGNTTSASIPILLYEAWRDGILDEGSRILMVVFGGGFSWETAFFRWTLPSLVVPSQFSLF